MGRKSKAKFELKGHTLPGINQKSETSNLKDGKSPSSAFQMQSPMKETTPTLKGVDINPSQSYAYKSAKIPSFRDIISLEQQQDYAKKVDERRAKRKEEKEWEGKKEAGAYTLNREDIDLESKKAPEATTEVSVPGEVTPENEINIGSNASSYGI